MVYPSALLCYPKAAVRALTPKALPCTTWQTPSSYNNKGALSHPALLAQGDLLQYQGAKVPCYLGNQMVFTLQKGLYT